MNRSGISSALIRLILILLVLSASAKADTSGHKAEGMHSSNMLHIKGAYQPERPGFMSMHAGYLNIENRVDEDIYIVGVTSPDYQSVSIHRSFQIGGVYKMENVSSLKIPAGQTVSLEPGGLHLMLHGPLVQRMAGDVTKMMFELCEGQLVPFTLTVKKP